MTESTDLALSPRLPSSLEIAGLVAAGLPFVFSMASSSSTTVDGVVTSASYRDPVAIGGGGIAIVCGLIAAATLLAKTEPAKKSHRALLCLALVGVGIYQLLRGLGLA